MIWVPFHRVMGHLDMVFVKGLFKCFTSFNFKKIFYLFLEIGEGREKKRERNISVWLPLAYSLLGTYWPATHVCALTGNQASDPLVHRLAFIPLSHNSQGCFTSF